MCGSVRRAKSRQWFGVNDGRSLQELNNDTMRSRLNYSGRIDIIECQSYRALGGRPGLLPSRNILLNGACCRGLIRWPIRILRIASSRSPLPIV